MQPEMAPREVSSTDTTLDPALYTGTSTTVTGNILWRGQIFPIIQGGAEDADDSDSDKGDATSGDADGGTSDDKDDGKSGDEKMFTQDQLNAIVTRETQKATRGKLDPKELGFENAKDMKTWVDSMKKTADDAKTEDEKTREAAIEAAKREATDSVLSKANERILKAEFLLAAMDHGIRKEARSDAYLLAPTVDSFSAVEVSDDGKVTGFDDAFFEELKENKPYLFEPEGDDGDGSRGDIGAGRRGASKTDADKVADLRTTYPALQQR